MLCELHAGAAFIWNCLVLCEQTKAEKRCLLHHIWQHMLEADIRRWLRIKCKEWLRFKLPASFDAKYITLPGGSYIRMQLIASANTYWGKHNAAMIMFFINMMRKFYHFQISQYDHGQPFVSYYICSLQLQYYSTFHGWIYRVHWNHDLNQLLFLP